MLMNRILRGLTLRGSRIYRTKMVLENPYVDLVRASPLFDGAWYTTTYPDVGILGMDPVEHYLQYGGILNRRPSEYFDPIAYLSENPDVAASGLIPLVHYLRFGEKEGRMLQIAREVMAAPQICRFTTNYTGSRLEGKPNTADLAEKSFLFVDCHDVDLCNRFMEQISRRKRGFKCFRVGSVEQDGALHSERQLFNIQGIDRAFGSNAFTVVAVNPQSLALAIVVRAVSPNSRLVAAFTDDILSPLPVVTRLVEAADLCVVGVDTEQRVSNIFGNKIVCTDFKNSFAPLVLHWLESFAGTNNTEGFLRVFGRHQPSEIVASDNVDIVIVRERTHQSSKQRLASTSDVVLRELTGIKSVFVRVSLYHKYAGLFVGDELGDPVATLNYLLKRGERAALQE